nr:PREDICTED: uncharacterized protein LOC105674397 isoform X1 [Linepithema humile]XP_012226082.1 PREDICTED: uncharacterized protein LOC105674397 isoform X1 [Linepithema humile]
MSETSIDINGKKFINFDEESTKIPDHIFQIEFGRQGVQNCYVKKQYYYDIITNIIDEFNVDTNFGIAAGNSTKTHKTTSTVFNFFVLYDEDTMRASNCNTTALIVYHTNTLSHYNKYERFMYEEYITKFRFRLRLLPISYTNPTGETLWIERDRKACTEQPDYILLDFEEWEIDNITKYTNLINIRDDNPKFTSYTQLEGYVYFEMLTTLVQFEEDVYLHLLRIEAAREELNTTEYD